MEERVISLKKDKVISLKKPDSKGNNKIPKYIYSGLRWGKISKAESSSIEKSYRYVGNIFQRLLHIGPKVEETSKKSEIVEYNVDLDSSIIFYDKFGNIDNIIYYGEKENGYCHHFGDDIFGGGSKDKDNELILLYPELIPSNISYAAVIMNSYSHDKFSEIPYIKMRIYGSNEKSISDSSKIMAEFDISNTTEDFYDKETIVLGIFYRNSGDWNFKAIGRTTKEKSITEIAFGSAKDEVYKVKNSFPKP